MILFMVWATFVAGMAALAAGRVEAALESRGAPARWAWISALGASVGAGAWVLMRPPPAPSVSTGAWTRVPVAMVADLGSAVLPAPTLLARVDGLATALWVVGSLALALALAAGLLRLALRGRAWTPARVAGGLVHLSDDFGPAVVGVRAPRVVLPRWALGLEPERLRLIVMHEEEHRRAGDAALLLMGAVAVVAAPWNPALWWQLRRLRAAVEMDCDARVLRRGAPAAMYGRLLLEMGTRTSGLPLPVLAMSRPTSLLERRLTMIVRGGKRGGAGRAAMALAVAGALVAVACEAPIPTAVRPTEPVSDGQAAQVIPAGEIQAKEMLVELHEEGAAPIYKVNGVRVAGVPSIPPEQIERVEVVKGAAAEALEGPEARGGIIHLITKNAPAELRGAPAPEGARVKVREATPPSSAEPGGVVKLHPMGGARVFVDGEPFEGDVSTIAKETIARVEVVKGTKEGEPSSIYITLKR